MKKFGKTILLLLLLVSVGSGGFILGQNMEADMVGTASGDVETDRRIMKNIELYRQERLSFFL